MGTPRDSMRLVDEGGTIRLRTVKTGVDHTASMTAYAAGKTTALAGEDLCGYILKRDSPSCGMTRVKLYRGKGPPARSGMGLFARALLARFPQLPVEEEGRLNDPRLRENFIERVFAYRRLRDLFESRWTVDDLVRFHTAHKLVLLAHSTQAYTRLGRLVAAAKSADRASQRARYTAGFMAALATIATPRRHTNVLQHVAGHFKKVARRGVARRTAGRDRGLPPRTGAAAGTRHVGAAPRPRPQPAVPRRPDLPRASPDGIDAPQSRLSDPGRIIADSTQRTPGTQRKIGLKDSLCGQRGNAAGFCGGAQERMRRDVVRTCGSAPCTAGLKACTASG